MWTNWAGNQKTAMAALAVPATIDALREMILRAEGAVRTVGAGHSFMPLIPEADVIVDLSAMRGPPVIACADGIARVRAGARLYELSEALAGQGQAFRNLGDINVQSLAGAMGTATHGTGAELPCLSAEMAGAQIMDAQGDLIELAPEEIPGTRVALGALGIFTEIALNVVPAYDLRRRVHLAPVGDVLDDMHRHWAQHRHFEFFWLPHSGKAIQVAHDISSEPRGKPPVDLDNIAVKVMGAARSIGHLSPGLRRAIMALLLSFQSDEDFTGESWRVLSKPRNVRFVEMEYHLPPDTARDVIEAIIELTEKRHPDIFFPVEVRQTAGDDGWLSPFQGGNRVSVAIHAPPKEDATAYFRDAEALFRAAGGRPHWGKMHTLGRAELETLYPDMAKFDALRERLDPKGRFLTPQVRRMLVG